MSISAVKSFYNHNIHPGFSNLPHYKANRLLEIAAQVSAVALATGLIIGGSGKIIFASIIAFIFFSQPKYNPHGPQIYPTPPSVTDPVADFLGNVLDKFAQKPTKAPPSSSSSIGQSSAPPSSNASPSSSPHYANYGQINLPYELPITSSQTLEMTPKQFKKASSIISSAIKPLTGQVSSDIAAAIAAVSGMMDQEVKAINKELRHLRKEDPAAADIIEAHLDFLKLHIDNPLVPKPMKKWINDLSTEKLAARSARKIKNSVKKFTSKLGNIFSKDK